MGATRSFYPTGVIFAACLSLLLVGMPFMVGNMTVEVPTSVYKQTAGNVVIVHLGNGERVEGIPMQQTAQLVDNVEQLRLFNPAIPIFVVVSADVNLPATEAARLIAAGVHLVPTNTLPQTAEHMKWQQNNKLAQNPDRNFFWRYASERFFYLSDVAVQMNLTNIIHIAALSDGAQEYDNLVYIDLHRILPILEQLYPAAGVFDNPQRCIPGFMFFKSATNVLQLAQYMSAHAGKGLNDMDLVGQYRAEHPTEIVPLPILDVATYPEPVDAMYGTHFADLGCVFDGAAYGQYLGGVDPRNIPGNTTGFVNAESVIKTNKLTFSWRQQGSLLVPYVNGIQIVNLHIHSKNTTKFRSDQGVGVPGRLLPTR